MARRVACLAVLLLLHVAVAVPVVAVRAANRAEGLQQITVFEPDTPLPVGSRVRLSGLVRGPGHEERAVFAQRRVGKRWARVADGRVVFGSRYDVLFRGLRTPGTMRYRVVSPSGRGSDGRRLRRLVSRTVDIRFTALRLTWSLPATAAVGSTVTATVRAFPLRGERFLLEQLVNGAWQVAGVGATGRDSRGSLTHVLLAHGVSRFRVRFPYPGAISATRSLRGTGPGPALATRRVSVASNGSQVNGSTRYGKVSGDGGLVVMTSDAGNLAPHPRADGPSLFVKDLTSGKVQRVSHTPDGADAGGTSSAAVISSDASSVAFVSDSALLVADDHNGVADLFIWTRASSVVTRVATAAKAPSLSADSRFVAYVSQQQVFLLDRQSGQARRISQTPMGEAGNGPSSEPSVSADGGRVAYATTSTNLTPGGAGIVVWDAATGSSELVSVTSGGSPAAGTSSSPLISGDGAVVAFTSTSPNLGVPQGVSEAFTRDIDTDTTTALTPQRDPSDGAHSSWAAAITTGGSTVLVTSDDFLAPGDVDDDTGSCQSESQCYGAALDSYTIDVATGTTTLVSLDGKAARPNGTRLPSISPTTATRSCSPPATASCPARPTAATTSSATTPPTSSSATSIDSSGTAA